MPHESESDFPAPTRVPAPAWVPGRVTVGAQELVELVQIANRLVESEKGGELFDEWRRANAALARTVELVD